MKKILKYFPLNKLLVYGNIKALLKTIGLYWIFAFAIFIVYKLTGWIPLIKNLTFRISDLVTYYSLAGTVLSVYQYKKELEHDEINYINLTDLSAMWNNNKVKIGLLIAAVVLCVVPIRKNINSIKSEEYVQQTNVQNEVNIQTINDSEDDVEQNEQVEHIETVEKTETEEVTDIAIEEDSSGIVLEESKSSNAKLKTTKKIVPNFGGFSEYIYDSDGMLLKRIYRSDDGSIGSIEEYDKHENRDRYFERYVEPKIIAKDKYEYKYYPDGKLEQSTWYANNFSDGEYHEIRTERYEYDSNGNLVKSIKVGDEEDVTLYEYNNLGQLTKKIDNGRNEVSEYTYVKNEVITRIETQEAIEIAKTGDKFEFSSYYFKHDDAGKLIYGKEPILDEEGKIVKILGLDSQENVFTEREFTYDFEGNVVEYITYESNPNFSCSKWYNEFEYDKSGKVIKWTHTSVKRNPEEGESDDVLVYVYEYDKNGNLITVSLNDKKRFFYEYDALGNPIKYTKMFWDDVNKVEEINEYEYDSANKICRFVLYDDDGEIKEEVTF